MRIGILHNLYRYRGGEDRVAVAEAQLLESAGHFVSRNFVDNRDVFATVGRRLRAALVVGSGWNMANGPDIQAWARAERLDVVHVHNIHPFITAAGVEALGRLRIPVVCTLHNYRLLCANGTLERDGKPCDACIGGSGVAAIRYGCYRSSRLQSAVWAAGRAQAAVRGTWSSAVDRFIAPSTAVRDEYVLAGFEPARIDVRAHFTSDPGECPGERSGVLYVGRLSRHKGIVDLIRKWPSDEPTLTVIGTGPEESEVVAAAGPNVILLGERTPEQVSREMSKAAVVVLPSRVRESFGLTLIEAAAHGCAAVAYDRGGPRDIIVPDCTGSLVPFDRPEQFLPRVLSLARCAEVSRRRGERARQWYLGRFTPERGLRSLLDVYERALTPRADVA